MDRCKGKVALVTGAASNPGLGYSTCQRLAEEGAIVIATDMDEAGAQACIDDLKAKGGDGLAFKHDVTKIEDWEHVIAGIDKAYGRLDCLVNNAGIAVLKTLEDMSLDDFRLQNRVNMIGPYIGMKISLPLLRKGERASIVNLSSVAGLIGLPTAVAYSASKFGVKLLSKAMAIELGMEGGGMRVNSVHPGVIWTNMQAGAQADTAEPEENAPILASIPMGKMGEALDIANAIVYLASDASRFVTGAELTIDGGMTAQ